MTDRHTTRAPQDRPDRDPDERLEGYDPSQRAEILEAEGDQITDNATVTELQPDRGESVTSPAPPEEELHDPDRRIDNSVADTDAPLASDEPLDRTENRADPEALDPDLDDPQRSEPEGASSERAEADGKEGPLPAERSKARDRAR